MSYLQYAGSMGAGTFEPQEARQNQHQYHVLVCVSALSSKAKPHDLGRFRLPWRVCTEIQRCLMQQSGLDIHYYVEGAPKRIEGFLRNCGLSAECSSIFSNICNLRPIERRERRASQW